MLYAIEDAMKLRSMIESGEADEARKGLERRKLDALISYAESPRCRRQVLLNYFGEDRPDPCGACDICRDPVSTFDGTLVAQKALSCVYRTGQRFGAAHLTDVLLGSKTERLRELGHDALPVFGIGRDYARSQWRDIFRQLIAHGLLVFDMEGHGGLSLGPADLCRPVLRGEAQVILREDTARFSPKAEKRERKRAEKRARPSAGADSADDSLFTQLRALRLELAQKQNVPPYVIFHDSTLYALADQRPQSLADMAAISGIGAVKLDRYGQAFLNLLKATVA